MGVAGIDPMSTDALEEDRPSRRHGIRGRDGLPVRPGLPSHQLDRDAGVGTLPAPRLPDLRQPPRAPVPGAILEFDRPLNWDEVARSIPELPIVLGGIGTPWVEETLLLLQKHPRIFADTAGLIRRPWHLFQALLGASSMGVIDKVLFASGWPVETPSKAIETIYSVNSFSQGTQLPSIPRPQLRRSSSGISRPCSACLSPRRSPTRSPSSQPLPSSEA